MTINIDHDTDIRSLINVLDRETYDLCEEFSGLSVDQQLERIGDLRVLARTLKQFSDADNR